MAISAIHSATTSSARVDSLVGDFRWVNEGVSPDDTSTTTIISIWFDDTQSGGAWLDWEKDAFWEAMATIEAVANIRFVQARDAASATLVEAKYKQEDLLVDVPNEEGQPEDVLGEKDANDWYAGGAHTGPAVYPDVGFTATQAFGSYNVDHPAWLEANAAPGGTVQEIFVHEVLHGLGFQHPHDEASGSGLWPGVGDGEAFNVGDLELNSRFHTIMSYNFIPNVGFDQGWAEGPMAFDIAALQLIYGANTSKNAGHTVYDIPVSAASAGGWQSIWDTGGTDTIRYRGSHDAYIDLRPTDLGEFVPLNGLADDGIQAGFTIAKGVVIERAYGGEGSDIIFGNSVANYIRGNGEGDYLYGAGGSDVIKGGAGNDHIYGDTFASGFEIYGGGAAGNDKLYGDGGADSFEAGGGNDKIYIDAEDDVEELDFRWLDGGDGYDTVYSQTLESDVVDLKLIWTDVEKVVGGKGSELFDGGNVDESLTLSGGYGSDVLIGGNTIDFLSGNERNDWFVASTANDQIDGGAHFDIYDARGDDGGIKVNLGDGFADGFEGYYDKIASIEGVLTGGGDDEVVGSKGDNLIATGAGNDTIQALNGDDIILAGAGENAILGGAGKDTFVFLNEESSNVIKDFEKGVDLIDLSAFKAKDAMLAFADFDIVDLGGDALITIGDFKLVVAGAADFLGRDSFLMAGDVDRTDQCASLDLDLAHDFGTRANYNLHTDLFDGM